MNPIALIGLASAGVSLAQETIKGLSSVKDLASPAASRPTVSFDQHLTAELEDTTVDLRPYLEQNEVRDIGGLHAHLSDMTEALLADPAVANWSRTATVPICLEQDASGSIFLRDDKGATFPLQTEALAEAGARLHQLYALEASAALDPTLSLGRLASQVQASFPVSVVIA